MGNRGIKQTDLLDVPGNTQGESADDPSGDERFA